MLFKIPVGKTLSTFWAPEKYAFCLKVSFILVLLNVIFIIHILSWSSQFSLLTVFLTYAFLIPHLFFILCSTCLILSLYLNIIPHVFVDSSRLLLVYSPVTPHRTLTLLYKLMFGLSVSVKDIKENKSAKMWNFFFHSKKWVVIQQCMGFWISSIYG